MKLLILEYVTAGGLGNPLNSPLLEEANAMALALARDFSELSDYSVSLLRHPSLVSSSQTSTDQIILTTGLAKEWEQALSTHDQVIIIAPETDSILLEWSGRADTLGIKRLGSTLEAIRIGTDKSITAQRLKECAISHIPTYRIDTFIPWGIHDETWVLKPRDGCGCEGIQHFRSQESVQRAISHIPPEMRCHWILQPWQNGMAASLTLLGHAGGVQLLSMNEQVLKITEQGEVTLEEVRTGSIKQDPEKFEHLAQSVHAAIPGLFGIYGIDLILDQQDLTVVEINPRVTSAYPDLRVVLGINPAKLWQESHSF